MLCEMKCNVFDAAAPGAPLGRFTNYLGQQFIIFPPVDTECSVWIWTRSCQACQKRNDCFGNPFYMFYAVVMKLHDLDHTLD